MVRSAIRPEKDTVIRTTVQFLDLLCDHFKYLSEDGKTAASDYRVAKELGVTQQTVSKWRTGKNGMDEETAIRVADILNKEREYLLACVLMERYKSSKVRDTLKGIALGGTSAAMLALAVFHAVPSIGI